MHRGRAQRCVPRTWQLGVKLAQYLGAQLQPQTEGITVAARPDRLNETPTGMTRQQGVAVGQNDAQVERVAAFEEASKL